MAKKKCIDFLIRKELEKDYTEVYNVVKSAFENAAYSDKDEHNLVNRLRKSENFIPDLSLVVEYNNSIIGHIIFTKIKVEQNDLIALGPLSVLPEFQGNGVGSKVITKGHKIALELGYKGSIVVGHENYYTKFGYKPASIFGIIAPFDVPDKNFVDKSLESIKGKVEYAKEFFEI